MFESIKKRSAAARIIEEQLYEQVVNELASGKRRNGLWAKAIANSNGQDEQAKALYIQYRVQSLQDEYELLHGENGAKEPYIDTAVAHGKGNNIQQDADTTQEESVLWIHVLVWSIFGLILLGFLAQ
ncbi:MAG: hypothetical protein Q9M30_09855 [Mariprofundaceae bacterium]|nr:hypothetical protein [Mariprofundaceae bacterium]